MALTGVIWKSCSPDIATAACASFWNSTNAMPGRASTIRTCASRAYISKLQLCDESCRQLLRPCATRRLAPTSCASLCAGPHLGYKHCSVESAEYRMCQGKPCPTWFIVGWRLGCGRGARLLVAGVLVEQQRQHVAGGRLRQVLHEQDVVRRGLARRADSRLHSSAKHNSCD